MNYNRSDPGEEELSELLEHHNSLEIEADRVVVPDDESSGKKGVYNIAYSEQQIDPWSKSYIGIPANYFSVGFVNGGSTSILYPVLVVHEGVTSSLLTASTSIITIFWSYKIIFGFLSDCFPIFGWKRKSYMALGWILCSTCLISLASMGQRITATHLVLMLTLANLGYVASDVAADGFMVWVAHREPIHKRGRMQTLIYATNTLGHIVINIIILFGFSGPLINCPGYESDLNIPCTTDVTVSSRNDMAELHPDTWCHMKCSMATFDFNLTIPQFAWIMASVNIVSLPLYFMLKEDKSPRDSIWAFMTAFQTQLKKRAAWQVILYSMISNLTFGVINAAKLPANYVWLDLHTTQYQIMILMEKTIFFVGLNVVRRYALHVSWRKLIWCGSLLVTLFNCLYFIIVFDIWRNAWFYIFTDVSEKFMYTLNFIASLFCMVEVAEPGFEAITYSLITTASNSVVPLSLVISYQFMAFFPNLNTQETIATDTQQVRREFAALQVITIVINLSTLLCLPMLPRQKKETRDLVAAGESSSFWGGFALTAALVFLMYSTLVTFVTVAGHETYGCFKILGGSGCSEGESSFPAYVLVGIALSFSYGVNFYHSFWPIITGRDKFRFSMFF